MYGPGSSWRILKIFRLFGQPDNPIAQAGLWLFLGLMLGAAALYAFLFDMPWYWWSGGWALTAICLVQAIRPRAEPKIPLK